MICTLGNGRSECGIIHGDRRKGFVSSMAAEWITLLKRQKKGNEGQDRERNSEITVIWAVNEAIAAEGK